MVKCWSPKPSLRVQISPLLLWYFVRDMIIMKDTKQNIIVRAKSSLESEILRRVRFLVPAQSATISPPIGPILGQFGINIMDFCKQFNERSKYIDQDVLVFVDLVLFKNKSFVFTIRTPPVSFLINEENFEIDESSVPSFINLSSLYNILKIKNLDTPISDLSLMRSFFGTMRAMHLRVCNDLKSS
jgi:large subunit ribosomal protein L11